ncbi:MAG: hypothetical protein QNK05_00910 [Myxococcota bacterium]|nr:hypothetical protein [Myxococcota bacterium]
MLSRFDDYPIHQTPDPIAHPATHDRNVYDRYWFNGYHEDGDFYFGIGAALYPNLGILDCGFSIVHDGEQHSFHASRRAPSDRAELRVGPFEIQILEPMKHLRVVLDDNDTGIACELEWIPRTASIQEARQTYQRGRVVMDATRFNQFGSWRGTVRYAGRELAIDPDVVRGTKDRSWGIRPVGDPDPGGAPSLLGPQFFFLWAPLHWKDRCTHASSFEDSLGHCWHFDGMVCPVYESPDDLPGIEDPDVRLLDRCEHRMEFRPGTRRISGGELRLFEKTGERIDIQIEPLLCFQMKGIGYTHLEWGHGRWKGELATAGESWKSETLDPMAIDNQHVQQVIRVRTGDDVGVGVLEQLILGPYTPYGFRDVLDPA